MQPITWNQQVVKKNNKSLVLQIILEHESISRADIAEVSGLNKTTVSSLVNELLAEDLIFESGPGESSGGRRPVLLHFNKVAGYSIGIDIGVNYILGILTNLKGDILLEKHYNIQDTSYSAVTEIVHRIIQNILEELPNSNYGVIGIGIGVPGMIDKEGTILLAPNLGWKDISFRKEIENKFHLPVIIENEANAGVYGEKQFGAGQSFENIIYISAGIGIGAGIILDGELYQGKSGFSGEIGHMIIEVNGKPCSCGSKGCWEVYASEHSLLELANNKETTLESLIQLAENHDEMALKYFEQIGLYLGYGINNIINIFNPSQVIIGNRLAMAKQWIEYPIRQTIENHTLSFHQNEMYLNFSKLGKYSTALGVSAFAVGNFISSEEKGPLLTSI